MSGKSMAFGFLGSQSRRFGTPAAALWIQAGLAAVLDQAEPDDLILITSFGSGAGSDAFVFRATELLPDKRDRAATVRSMLDGSRRYLSYGEYAKHREKIIVNGPA